MTHRLINANSECQGTKQINSPDGGGRKASFKRDTDRLTESRGMEAPNTKEQLINREQIQERHAGGATCAIKSCILLELNENIEQRQ